MGAEGGQTPGRPSAYSGVIPSRLAASSHPTPSLKDLSTAGGRTGVASPASHSAQHAVLRAPRARPAQVSGAEGGEKLGLGSLDGGGGDGAARGVFAVLGGQQAALCLALPARNSWKACVGLLPFRGRHAWLLF